MELDESDSRGLSTAFGDGPGSLAPDERLGVAEVARRLFGVTETVRVGHYELRSRIGAGGMGQVFEAYDPRLQRRVALKILAADEGPRPLHGRDARLRHEARAMARLADPHIVAVYDAGIERGRAWIAMELVHGTNLRAWLQTPRTWGSVLETFLGAARGLAAIHAAGLVHCDFKPANVMIDEHGRARVTDFGLARFETIAPRSDEEIASVLGPEGSVPAGETPMITGGTPAYMAPEQHELGTPSPAADQYAFCVALHEALWGRARTGVHPAKGHPPRRLRRVVDKGMHPDPQRRFSGMPALIEALQRARMGWRTSWVAIGVVALGLVGFTQAPAVDPCQAVAADVAKRWWPTARARMEASMYAADPQLGPHAWQDADARVGAWVDAWSQAWLEQCSGMPGPATSDRARCLEAARARVGGTERALQGLDASSLPRVSLVLDGLPAIDACEGELTDAERAAPLDPARRDFWAAARSQLEEARTLRRLGRMREARRVLDGLALDPVHDASLELEARILRGTLSAEVGDVATAHRVLDRGYYDAIERGDDELAMSAALAMLDLLVVRQTEPASVPVWIGAATSMLERSGGSSFERTRLAALVALAFLDQNDLGAAASWSKVALDEAGTDADRIAAHQSAAYVALLSGDAADAMRHARKALAYAIDVRGEDHPDAALARMTFAEMLVRAGEALEARDHLSAALAVRERELGPRHPEIAMIANAMGHTYVVEGDDEMARSWYLRALQIAERTNASPAERVPPLQNLATLAMSMHDPDEAVRRFSQAHDACTSARGAAHSECGWIQVNFAQALQETGDHAGARRMLQEGAAVLDRDEAPVHQRAQTLVDLGVALGEEGGSDSVAVATVMRAMPLLLSAYAQGSVSVEQITRAARWLEAHPLPRATPT